MANVERRLPLLKPAVLLVEPSRRSSSTISVRQLAPADAHAVYLAVDDLLSPLLLFTMVVSLRLLLTPVLLPLEPAEPLVQQY